MLQQDYLMRLIMQFVRGLRRSLDRGLVDPADAAESVEDAISQALDLDASVMLGLDPRSFASILSVSGTEPRIVEYLVRGLLLEAHYLDRAGKTDMAELRRGQAFALADEYGMERPEGDGVLTEDDLDRMEQEECFDGELDEEVQKDKGR